LPNKVFNKDNSEWLFIDEKGNIFNYPLGAERIEKVEDPSTFKLL